MYHGLVERPLAAPDYCFLDSRAFARQMTYLARRCRVVPLSEALRWTDAREPVVVLTFDDGFASVWTQAYPVLRALGLPATVFLATGFIDSKETFWFCRLHEALARTRRQRVEWQGRSYALDTPAARARTSHQLQERLKRYPGPRVQNELAAILAALGCEAETPVPPDSPYRLLARAQIQAMARSGLIEFGAHSVTHAILSRLSLEERRREIRQSLEEVEGLTGRPCRLFAYPNGRAEDFGDLDKVVLRQAGVQMAVTALPGPNPPRTDPLALRRSAVGGETALPLRFRLLAHGLHRPTWCPPVHALMARLAQALARSRERAS
jgi:peptidoglycan/xylan/chitin deacetylase (PgdA/CDA1 family)